MVHCENVGLRYNGKLVFSNLSFSVAKGESLCVCGSSGKGKTSVLMLLQAYLKPSEGAISIEGERFTAENIHSLRKKIAWVPQNIHLPVECCRELLQMMEIESKEVGVLQFMERLGLQKELFHKPFNEISGGQKQRLIIAVCLSLGREIVLLDEPTASLDDESIDMLIQTVKSVKNVAIISASHNQKWIEQADKCVHL